MPSTGEDGGRVTRNGALALLGEADTRVQNTSLTELSLGAFTRNEPVTLRRVLQSRTHPLLLFVGDLVIVAVTQAVVHGLASDKEGMEALLAREVVSPEAFAARVCAVTTIVLLALYRGYRDLHRPYMELARDVMTAGLWSIFLPMAAMYLYGSDPGVEREATVLAGVLAATLLCLWRIPFVRRAKDAYCRHEVTLVSVEPRRWQVRMEGYVSIHHALTPADFLNAPPATDRVLIAPDVPVEYREQIVNWAVGRQVDLYVVPNTYEIMLASGRLTQINDVPVLTVTRIELSIELRAIKRLVDVVGALVLFAVFLPVFIIVPVLIWIEDRGPVFYRQVRVGRDGRLFHIIKFRTMIQDAEKNTGPVWARENDPRVTRIGRWLRGTRLDELPQIFNVLRGEMSLVGPRPERPELVIEFAAHNPLFRAREALKPGITGLAQVLGPYDLDPEFKLKYDLLYIAGWRAMLDLIVLMWTIPVMLFPQNIGRTVGRVVQFLNQRRV